MVIATFDVRLPSDVLLQLKSSSEPIQVDAHWVLRSRTAISCRRVAA
jgi:hypothetical protein